MRVAPPGEPALVRLLGASSVQGAAGRSSGGGCGGGAGPSDG
jgi:hypothetical protein